MSLTKRMMIVLRAPMCIRSIAHILCCGQTQHTFPCPCHAQEPSRCYTYYVKPSFTPPRPNEQQRSSSLRCNKVCERKHPPTKTLIVPHDMVYNRREEGKQGEGEKLWEFPRGRKEGGGAYPPQGKTTNFFPTALSRHSSLSAPTHLQRP